MDRRDDAIEPFDAAYKALVDVAAAMDEDTSWCPTACDGWAARDLLFHCLGDAQRALVALHSPTDLPADRDAVTYWKDWKPDPTAAANGRRFVRVAASMFLHYEPLRDLSRDTLEAVRDAAKQVPQAQRLRTQGHVLTCGDLLRTLSVEASLHHLDMLAGLPHLPQASMLGLTETRKTVELLLGRVLPATWDDVHCARVCTGRAALSQEERRLLGEVAERLPVIA